VKEENAHLLADSHNILSRRKNYFYQLLNVHSVSDVRQIENRSPIEPETAIANLKMYTSPCSDQISAEIIQAEVKYYCLQPINSFIIF
jgi:hypothetical protein